MVAPQFFLVLRGPVWSAQCHSPGIWTLPKSLWQLLWVPDGLNLGDSVTTPRIVCRLWHPLALLFMFSERGICRLRVGKLLDGGERKHGKIYTWICIYKTCAKSLQTCPTLCDPMDCSPPGSLSMGFSRQEYWSGNLPNPGIEPISLMSPALASGFFNTTAT